ncbi:hypothetical protein K458DRAFT_417345 [Lentithecium fluviatile CBS 122367]|uniref:Thymidylate kinase protein n=1 Tax=Lentithecium fluviatile CBS 122367 TaxID=1168545 RepID=A0A6G1J439_9PLEO|nr:hypothetical protein K458DRAFT_417345 [Lentithecium fluviatile CBS 122367]
MALSTRQPFAELGTPRLQALQSAKNRQNAITPTSAFSSPLKPSLTSSTGKRRASSVFDDNFDAENIDPSIFNSPTKKSKISSDFSKPSKFSLITSSSAQASPAVTASPSISSVRKALSSPTTTTLTPISTSRGSPKIHKRISAISKRRASSSPFRRVDPPSFSHSSPALPFSIDAALSGTIPNYTPKSTTLATPAATLTPNHVSSIEESMPKGWFFEIHEDTPEQEAANLMEHSASVLDISSDDDFETKQLNEERGKENIPPPDFLAAQQGARQAAADAMLDGEEVAPVETHVKLPRLRKITQDAMDEDRKPLGNLPTAEFYGEGCDAGSYVTVDPGLERPSGLSKEFEFDCPTPEKKKTDEVVAEAVEPIQAEPAQVEESIQIYTDENAPQETPAPVAETAVEAEETFATAP